MLAGSVLVWASILAAYPIFGSQSMSETCMPGRGEVLVRSPSSDTIEANSRQSIAPKSGIFESPNWSRHNGLEPRCVYRFIANVGEKVHVKFDHFLLRGEMPLCSEDFLDIYVDVASSSLDLDRETALLNHLVSGEPHTTTPFSAAIYSTVLDRSALLGRFCQSILAGSPVEFISLHREVVLDYYTSAELDGSINSQYNRWGFNGTFEFIRDTAYYPGQVLSPTELSFPGTHGTISACRFRIDAAVSVDGNGQPGPEDLPGLTGELISPTYPGFHPDGLACAYQLIGRPKQRINVDVLELNLPEESATCTTDYLQFHDGQTASAEHPPIGPKFCGENRRFRIVSSGPSLLILFVTGSLIGSRSERTRLSDGATGLFKRRGFRLRYTFTDKLLSVYPNHHVWHIRGTECDYTIRSQGVSEAKFESPTYRSDQVLLPGHVCSFYFLGGLYDQHMEVVRIGFDELDLPSPSASIDESLAQSDKSGAIETRTDCDRGHLAVYGIRSLKGLYQLNEPVLNWTDQFGQINAEPDYVWCGPIDRLTNLRIGSNLDNSPIVGQHSLVLLRLNATGASLPGLRASFRVIYRFDRTFGVPGAPINSDMCQFLYTPAATPFAVLVSSDLDESSPHITPDSSITSFEHAQGWTNSPFYPNPYPSNSTCLYLFVPNQNGATREQIRLRFGTFETQASRNSGTHSTGQLMPFPICDQDFLELIEVHIPITQALFDALIALSARVSSMLLGPTSWIRQWQNIDEELRMRLSLPQTSVVVRPIAVYCGSRVPGPFLSHPQATAVLLRFHGTRNTQARGFTMHYEFVKPKALQSVSGSPRSTCGGNHSSLDQSGLIKTPNFPEPYENHIDCTWYLRGRNHDSQLQLHFQSFHLEGNSENCARAVVRIYEGSHSPPSFEFCGNQTNLPPLILSTSDAIVRFHTTVNRVKASGFRLVWTELLPVDPDGNCNGFRCEHTKHCISRTLECNMVANCGAFVQDGELVADNSDEIKHCMKAIAYNFLHIGIGVLLTFALLLGLVGFIYYREKKRKLKLLSDPLAALTGSKHSLASTNPGIQKPHRHQCPNSHNSNKSHHSHLHHSRSHHNSRTHLSIDAESVAKSTLTRTGSVGDGSTLGRRHPAQAAIAGTTTPHHHHHHHHHGTPVERQPRLAQIVPHDCASRHQLIPVQQLHRIPPPTSSRLQRKSSRPLPVHSGTLSRNGGTLTGSIHSGVVGTGSSGLSADVDGGLLIREKMQKISIV